MDLLVREMDLERDEIMVPRANRAAEIVHVGPIAGTVKKSISPTAVKEKGRQYEQKTPHGARVVLCWCASDRLWDHHFDHFRPSAFPSWSG